MISKLIAWGANREQAMNRMIRALQEYEILGIHTTIPFLIKVMEHPAFRSGKFTTQFIEEYQDTLFTPTEETAETAAFTAVLDYINEKSRIDIKTPSNGAANGSLWKSIHRSKALRS
jgi:acetyl/propionyl-CoA carboxylase alpha subunit